MDTTLLESPEAAAPQGFAETEVVSVVEGEFQIQLPPPVENPYLEFLMGPWQGVYDLAGNVFDVEATVSWVYNHQYAQGLNRSRGAIGTMESQEIWQPTPEKGVFKLFYFDSFGGAGLGKAVWSESGNAFVIEGDDPSTGPFRNRVIVERETGDLKFILELGPDEEGKYRPIGRGHYWRPKA